MEGKGSDSEICQMVDWEKARSTVIGHNFELLSLPSSRGHKLWSRVWWIYSVSINFSKKSPLEFSKLSLLKASSPFSSSSFSFYSGSKVRAYSPCAAKSKLQIFMPLLKSWSVLLRSYKTNNVKGLKDRSWEAWSVLERIFY